MLNRVPFLFVAVVFLLHSPIAAAQVESRPASKPKRPDIYDTKTEGKVIVEGALKRAAAQDKRVLVVFGGNWCGWCHKLHDLLKTNDSVSKLAFNEYETAWIDIGKNDRNQDLVKEY